MHASGKIGISQRPKKRPWVPMNSRNATGAGASTTNAGGSRRASTTIATAAAIAGTQPSPHVNVHR
jgi:hypothetical protein